MSSTSTGFQVGELVRALALGWKNLAAYPPGHPALVGSVESAHRRLKELRGPAGEVVLGIARDGLIYGPEKIDSTHAQKFAQALYSRGVAVIRFGASTEPHELETFLRLLGTAPGEQSAPIWEELTAAGVSNIHLQPVDYSAVQVTDDLAAKPPSKAETPSLWEDILRALMAGRELSAEGKELLSREVKSVSDLATLVFEYLKTLGKIEPEAEFDPDATFGVRLQIRVPELRESAETVATRVAEAIGLHIARASGLRKQLAVQQVVQLLRTLPEPMRKAVLQSVVRVLATDESAGSLLRDFATAVPPDEILDMLRYLATLPGLSRHAMTLIETLVAIDKPITPPQPVTPSAVGDLVHLFGEDDVDRFNPEDHRALLSQVSVDIPRLPERALSVVERLGDRVETVTDDAVNRQLSRTLLDLLSRYGSTRPAADVLERLEALFRSHLASGQFAAALETLEGLEAIGQSGECSPELRKALDESLARLASQETISTLVESVHTAAPESTPMIQRLIEVMGAAAARSLLIALAEENNRSRRRRLFDFVASLGPVIVPEATKFLSDSRWYVVRNMIVLLRTVNDRSSLTEIRRNARHTDLRVRLEAIKSLLSFESSVPQNLLENAIHDPDPKLAETAVTLVGNYGIKEGVDPLLKILQKRDLFGARRSLRLKAIRALGELGEPTALSRMEQLFSDSILPWPAKEERRAAYESLATYPREARLAIAERGLRSRDPQIREIARKLLADKR